MEVRPRIAVVAAVAGVLALVLVIWLVARADGDVDVVNREGPTRALPSTVVPRESTTTVETTPTTSRTSSAAASGSSSTAGPGATVGGSSSTAGPGTTAGGSSTTAASSAPGGQLTVGPGQQFATLQTALDAARPGDVVILATAGVHKGPVVSKRAGTAALPIRLTAAAGARLDCGAPASGVLARCFELVHPYYVFDGFSIEGGSSNLYMTGATPGSYVHDVKVLNSTLRGARGGGTGECIRVKYQAYNIEIAHNNIADCGLGKCCDDSKNGEGVYIGTAPEQLEDKNPSAERDRTHNVWVHHNIMRPLNECVDVKEAAHNNLIEHNTCTGQRDENSGGMGARGGRANEGNVFRFNLIVDTAGACVRFGGDEAPDGTGNEFYGNTCRDIGGEYGVAQQRTPQGFVCGNRFEGQQPSERLSRDKAVDPVAPCPAEVATAGAASPGAG